MRGPRPTRADRASPRLLRRGERDRTELWTETVGTAPSVYGERWAEYDGRAFRAFEPARSKLAAAIVRGWEGPLPNLEERWLYLGAASGTTASHVADLVGPRGAVYAVERSVRPFARLLATSRRWPNLLPILADARAVDRLSEFVPPVDGLYADVAQPDQVEIAMRAAELFVDGRSAAVVLALKASSMGRERPPSAHAARAEEVLGAVFDLVPSVKLDPFHRAHFLLGGRRSRAGGGDAIDRSITRPRGRPRGPPPR